MVRIRIPLDRSITPMAASTSLCMWTPGYLVPGEGLPPHGSHCAMRGVWRKAKTFRWKFSRNIHRAHAEAGQQTQRRSKLRQCGNFLSNRNEVGRDHGEPEAAGVFLVERFDFGDEVTSAPTQIRTTPEAKTQLCRGG